MELEERIRQLVSLLMNTNSFKCGFCVLSSDRCYMLCERIAEGLTHLVDSDSVEDVLYKMLSSENY